MPLTVGTAGHIDHGKTWLVRALTGKDTDRLPEEQARGISIDLGYAPLDLPDGRRLSLVDVPGHERFVRTMVAGATGIDLFLLVIDAGERQVPYVLERRDEPLELPIVLEPRAAPPTGAQQSGAISYYRVRLPFANLPSAQLVLTTSARVFERIAALSVERPADARHRDAWLSQIATGRWAHAEQSRPAPALTLPLSPVDATELLLVISEGDNSRLPITTARLLLPSYRIRLFRDDRAALRMVYGRSDLGPPSYDLAILAPQVLGVSAREVRPGAEEAGPAARPEPGRHLERLTVRTCPRA